MDDFSTKVGTNKDGESNVQKIWTRKTLVKRHKRKTMNIIFKKSGIALNELGKFNMLTMLKN